MDTIKVEKSKMEPRCSNSSDLRGKQLRFHSPLIFLSGEMPGKQDTDTLTSSEPCIESIEKVVNIK